jgi:hypothetical protein
LPISSAEKIVKTNRFEGLSEKSPQFSTLTSTPLAGMVGCFEEQQRNKQPNPIPSFYSRTSSYQIPPVKAEIQAEVVNQQNNLSLK